jgi:hypothetical protein
MRAPSTENSRRYAHRPTVSGKLATVHPVTDARVWPRHLEGQFALGPAVAKRWVIWLVRACRRDQQEPVPIIRIRPRTRLLGSYGSTMDMPQHEVTSLGRRREYQRGNAEHKGKAASPGDPASSSFIAPPGRLPSDRGDTRPGIGSHRLRRRAAVRGLDWPIYAAKRRGTL